MALTRIAWLLPLQPSVVEEHRTARRASLSLIQVAFGAGIVFSNWLNRFQMSSNLFLPHNRVRECPVICPSFWECPTVLQALRLLTPILGPAAFYQ